MKMHSLFRVEARNRDKWSASGAGGLDPGRPKAKEVTRRRQEVARRCCKSLSIENP